MKGNLKQLRLMHNETQEELAEFLNISVTEYNEKENGPVSLTNHEKDLLSKHFNAAVENIMKPPNLREKEKREKIKD